MSTKRSDIRGASIAETFGLQDWTCVSTWDMTQEWDPIWFKENIKGECRTLAVYNFFKLESDAILFTLRFK